MPTDMREKPANVEAALREVSKIGSIVTAALDDGVRSARQAIKHGRYAAEDAIEETKHTVKRMPLEAMGIVLAAGVAAGAFVTWLGFRRR